MDKMQSAPVVFLQYLSAMAVVKGIKNYAKGYEKIPVKLKWPNDICTCQLFILLSMVLLMTNVYRCTRSR